MSGANRFEEIRRDLNRRGRRMTSQRAAILAVLKGRRDHPTAEQIHAAVQARLPRISLGTVYRNLQVLVEAGYALRFPSKGGTHRFDGEVARHDHVICRACGRIDDVHFEADPALLRRVARESGFRVVGQRTEFEGVCADCAPAGDRPGTRSPRAPRPSPRR